MHGGRRGQCGDPHRELLPSLTGPTASRERGTPSHSRATGWPGAPWPEHTKDSALQAVCSPLFSDSVPQPHPHPECVIVSLLQASCAIFCPSPAHSPLGHMCPALSWQGRFTAGRSLSPSCFTSLSSLPRGTFAELLNPAFCKVTSFRPSAPLTWVLSWTG